MLNAGTVVGAAGSTVTPGAKEAFGSAVATGPVAAPPSPRTSRRIRNQSTKATTATAAPRVPVLGDESDGRRAPGFCWLMEKVLRERNRRRLHGSSYVAIGVRHPAFPYWVREIGRRPTLKRANGAGCGD